MAKQANSSRRKKVVRLMIAFVAVLAFLTFFSNTIMNMTIPKVMGEYKSYGNLSYSNDATGVIKIDNGSNVKGIEGREIEKVLVSEYDEVKKGDPLFQLKALEESDDLADLRRQLRDKEREIEYDKRTPDTNDSVYAAKQAVKAAEEAVKEDKKNLANAKKRNSTIKSSNKIINKYESSKEDLSATVQSQSSTVESLQSQIDELNAELKEIKKKIDDLKAGRTKPQTNEDGEVEDANYLNSSKKDIESKISKLKNQLAPAKSRQSKASKKLTKVSRKVDSANAKLAEAETWMTVTEAAKKLADDQETLRKAKEDLHEAGILKGIDNDKAKDLMSDNKEEVERLKKKIAELEASAKISEIKAPADGYVTSIQAAEGDTLTKDGVIAEIIPTTAREVVAEFNFSAEIARELRPGAELSIKDGYAESCVVSSIKPDPEDPRNSRIVKCKLDDAEAYPGMELTVVASRGNHDYENVIPASAVNHDNKGDFIYQIIGGSTPLGDKYTVKRVDVEVEQTDGVRAAITGDKFDGNLMIVTRTEKPLENGQRVRLEDFESGKSDDN